MVAMSGALMLSITVFMLAKHTSALYQRELRVANANLSSVVGFERLRSDIARAGFMASPNIRRDPFVCGQPVTDGTWPALLREASSVRITEIASNTLPDLFADNGLQPQRILMSGNYSSSEAFPIRAIQFSGDTFQVYLQVQSGPMARLGYSDPDADQTELLLGVFPAGRAIRIVDKSGRHHFGTIASVTAGAQPRVNIRGNEPALIFRSGSAIGCGLKGEETGSTINTVNFIQYDVRDLRDDDRYAPIYNTASAPEGEADRTELIREELDPQGDPIDGTAEIVAEYAVDLRFRLVVAPSPSTPLSYIPQGNVGEWAGVPSTLGAARGPQLIRAVHAWLSIRSREPDRQATITPPDGPLYRVGLGESGGAPFARVRTVQARVALHNQMGTTWQ